jgi:hypothetical protein
VTTQAKYVASKRKKSFEPEGDFFTLEKHLHDTVSEVRILEPIKKFEDSIA